MGLCERVCLCVLGGGGSRPSFCLQCMCAAVGPHGKKNIFFPLKNATPVCIIHFVSKNMHGVGRDYDRDMSVPIFPSRVGLIEAEGDVGLIDMQPTDYETPPTKKTCLPTAFLSSSSCL